MNGDGKAETEAGELNEDVDEDVDSEMERFRLCDILEMFLVEWKLSIA